MAKSKMITCKACGKEIAKSAKACPHCGAKVKHHRFLSIIIILIVLFIGVGVIGSKGPTISSKYASMSAEEIKNNCASVVYEDVARNPDKYKDTLITFKGKVIQKVDGNPIIFRISQDKDDGSYSSDAWYVRYTRNPDRINILEDDNIIVYGECKGTQSYTNAFGAKITIPSLVMIDYTLPDKEN